MTPHTSNVFNLNHMFWIHWVADIFFVLSIFSSWDYRVLSYSGNHVKRKDTSLSYVWHSFLGFTRFLSCRSAHYLSTIQLCSINQFSSLALTHSHFPCYVKVLFMVVTSSSTHYTHCCFTILPKSASMPWTFGLILSFSQLLLLIFASPRFRQSFHCSRRKRRPSRSAAASHILLHPLSASTCLWSTTYVPA